MLLFLSPPLRQGGTFPVFSQVITPPFYFDVQSNFQVGVILHFFLSMTVSLFYPFSLVFTSSPSPRALCCYRHAVSPLNDPSGNTGQFCSYG